MFKKYLPWYLLGLVALSLAFIYGCGAAPTSGGGGGGVSGRHYYGMDSMGGTVKCTVNDTAFSVHFESGTFEGITISGKITHLASGLLSGEITGSSDTDKVSPEGTLYAYEVTNEVLVIGGGPENQQVIMILPALSSTAPFSLASSYEGIVIPMSYWQNLLFACVTMELTGSNSYTFEAKLYDVAATYLDSTSEANYHFTGGRLWKTDYHPQFFVSPKGMFAGINGKDSSSGDWKDGGFVGTMYDSTVSTTELATDKCYIGMSFDRDLTNNNTYVEAITVESTAPNELKVSSMEVSSGAAIGDPKGIVTLVQMDVPGQGIIDATIISGSGPSIPAKMVAYMYAPDKYAVCGFVSIESDATSFFSIEK